MPITDKLDLPIKRMKFSGPALDEHEQRKETNDNPRVKTEELRSSFDKVKNSVLAGLKALTSTPPRT